MDQPTSPTDYKQYELKAESVESVGLYTKRQFKDPYFLIAYWPNGNWMIEPGFYNTPHTDALVRSVKRLLKRGALIVRLMKLPNEREE
jgi:hypothetical protein